MPERQPDTEVNPLDIAIEATDELVKESAAQRDAKDLQLWQAWKKDPTPVNMDPLMQRFEPMFRGKTRMWKAPNVNQASFMTNLRINAVDAFQTFNPQHKPKRGSRSASLRTHLGYKLQRTKRFNVQHQNYAYMPEGQVGHIGVIQRAQDALGEELGRDPKPIEIRDWANPRISTKDKLTTRKVTTILKGQRKDIIGSTFESDPTPHAIQREREVASLLRPSLDTEQQAVYDYLYGQSGKPQVTSTSAIAKALGKSPSQISRLRTGILKKFDEAM